MDEVCEIVLSLKGCAKSNVRGYLMVKLSIVSVVNQGNRKIVKDGQQRKFVMEDIIFKCW